MTEDGERKSLCPILDTLCPLLLFQAGCLLRVLRGHEQQRGGGGGRVLHQPGLPGVPEAGQDGGQAGQVQQVLPPRSRG